VLFKNTETIEPKSREFSPVFKKGDNVIIVVRKGDITIEMKGKALRDGFENEDAEVRVKSGKLIKGKISDGKVIVNL
jgi:flagella basal body P-ring formation protein FlgA